MSTMGTSGLKNTYQNSIVCDSKKPAQRLTKSIEFDRMRGNKSDYQYRLDIGITQDN